jgi:hypothetical protein
LTDGLDADFVLDSQIKQAAVGFGAFPGEESAQEETPAESTDAPAVQSEDTVTSSDPTITHAGLTELDQPAEEEKPVVAADDLPQSIAEASIDDGSANKSAETQWDNAAATAGNDEQLDDSFEMVPRPADETEAVHEPAQPQSTSSWADQTSANATATEAAADNNNITNGIASTDAEGYQSVERRGGRGGQGRGGRGRGGRGGPRGGARGSFRGRGDGQGRGRGGRGGAPQPQA